HCRSYPSTPLHPNCPNFPHPTIERGPARLRPSWTSPSPLYRSTPTAIVDIPHRSQTAMHVAASADQSSQSREREPIGGDGFLRELLRHAIQTSRCSSNSPRP